MSYTSFIIMGIALTIIQRTYVNIQQINENLM